MATPKRQYTDGKNSFLLTDHEAAELNRTRPSYLPPISPVAEDTKIRVNYQNQDGEIVDDLVPAENVRQRAVAGENVVATPESIEAARQDSEYRTRRAMADEEDLLSLTRSAVPGMQFVENAIVGEDAANQARQDLSVNVGANLVGNLAELAIGFKGLGMASRGLLGAERAAKLGVKLGLAKESSKLAKVGRVAAEEVIADTHFMLQGQLDHGQEFTAEEWGNQIGMGLILATPFVGGAALRGVGQHVRGALGPNALGTARTALHGLAAAAPVKSIQSAKYARLAAVTSITEKLFGKVRRKAPLGQTDEAVQRVRQVDADVTAANRLTPDDLNRMTPAKREAALEAYRRYADDPNALDGVDFPRVVEDVKTMRRNVTAVRREALNMHRTLQGNGVADIKMSDTLRNNILAQANGLLRHVEDAGMADVKGAIQRGIINGGGDAATMHKALFEAKVNARFRRGVDGGADVVDDALTDFLTNKEVGWTAKQLKNNRELVAAVDDVVQVWDDLGDIRIPGAPKEYSVLQVNDALQLGKNQQSIARLRAAVDKMESAGLLSQKQRVSFETAMVNAGDSISRGTKSYGDIVKTNRARESALGKLKKERDLVAGVPDSPESFMAAKGKAAMDRGLQLAELSAKGLDALLSTKPMAYGARGVGALHGLQIEEKYTLFEHIHENMVNLTGNPMFLIDRMAPVLDRGASVDPQGTDLAAQKAVNTIMYLQSQLPPVDSTIYGRGVPQPLSAVEEYLEKWMAAYDPVSVGWAALDGTVTPQMVNAVRATQPNLYAQMQVEFAHVLSQAPAEKVNPTAMRGVTIFMGGMDPLYDGKFIADLQSNYAQTSAQDEVINGPRRPMPNTDPKTAGTMAQRLGSY